MRKALVTDAELGRARSDPAFRHQLIVDSLQLLIDEMNKLRQGLPNSKEASQIRECGALAVKLAEMLQRMEAGNGSTASRDSAEVEPAA